MGKNTSAVYLTVCFLLLLGAVSTYAQAPLELAVDIPHAFGIAGKQLPAGRYHLAVTGEDFNTIAIHSEDGKTAALALVMTRIQWDQRLAVEPRVVFDVSGDQYILSELWLPGEDGYLIQGIKNDARHKHTSVKGKMTKP